MRTIYNITDKTPPQEALLGKARQPRSIRVGTMDLNPGAHMKIDDSVPLRSISGFVARGELSVNGVPAWYVSAKETDREAARVEVKEKARARDEKSVSVDVGAMTATVEAGPDGELGTDDDVKSIKPKKRSPKRGKKS